MKVQIDTVVGGIAGAVALVTIAVFGYRVASGDHGPPPPGTLQAAPDKLAGRVVVLNNEVVSGDYRFRLVAPDPSWRVFDRVEANAMWDGTVASMENFTTLVQVLADRVGDARTEHVIESAKSWYVTSTPITEHAIRWLDRDATELRGGTKSRHRVFVRDGFLFRVVISSSEDLRDDQIDRLWSCFTLLDGSLHPTSLATVADVRGREWRVVNGRWEGRGLAIAPPKDWRIIAGPDLAAIDPSAAVQLANDIAGARISVTAPSGIVIPQQGGFETSIANQPTRFGRFPSGWLVTQWIGFLTLRDSRMMISATVPSADGDAGTAVVRTGLAAIAALSDDERLALDRDVSVTPAFPTLVGDEWALRNGIYVHYTTGLVFRQAGAPGWRPSAGFGDTLVQLTGRSGEPAIWVMRDDSASSPVMWLTKNFGGKVTRLASSDGAEVKRGAGKNATIHRVAKLSASDTSPLRVHIAGLASAFRDHDRAITDAIAALDVVRRTASSNHPDGVDDRRLGFRIVLPGWSLATTEALADTSHYRWTGDLGTIGVIARHTLGGARSRIHQSRELRIASLRFSEGRTEAPRETDVTIGGEPAIRLAWIETYDVPILITVTFVDHAGLTYAIYTHGNAATVEASERAFSFVDSPI